MYDDPLNTLIEWVCIYWAMLWAGIFGVCAIVLAVRGVKLWLGGRDERDADDGNG